jgi:hypothetical protein
MEAKVRESGILRRRVRILGRMRWKRSVRCFDDG